MDPILRYCRGIIWAIWGISMSSESAFKDNISDLNTTILLGTHPPHSPAIIRVDPSVFTVCTDTKKNGIWVRPPSPNSIQKRNPCTLSTGNGLALIVYNNSMRYRCVDREIELPRSKDDFWRIFVVRTTFQPAVVGGCGLAPESI